MSDSKEHPRMLYKADASSNERQGTLSTNERIGYTTVNSTQEENEALANGWVKGPDLAEKALNKIDRNSKVKDFIVGNWKYWISTIIAITAVYVTYLGISK